MDGSAILIQAKGANEFMSFIKGSTPNIICNYCGFVHFQHSDKFPSSCLFCKALLPAKNFETYNNITSFDIKSDKLVKCSNCNQLIPIRSSFSCPKCGDM